MSTAPWILLAVVLVVVAAAALWVPWRRRRRRRGNAVDTFRADAAVNVGDGGDGGVVVPRADSVAEVVPTGATCELTEREALARLHAIAFAQAGLDAMQVDASAPAHARASRLVDAALSRTQAGTGHAPRRPLLLPRLLQAVNDGDASIGDIGAIIARDPALTGNLLRIANSALYRTWSQPVESIDRAVVLVGLDGIRHLMATALMQPVLGGGKGVFDRLAAILWHHGLLVATAAAMHARHSACEDAFRAQVLGLVHALGAITVVRTARDAYAQHAPLQPAPGVVEALLEHWTAPTARRLARDWELSRDVATALDEQQRDVALDALSPLGRSLRVGRAAGAVAMLQARGTIDATAGLALLLSMGVDRAFAERTLERLARVVAEPLFDR